MANILDFLTWLGDIPLKYVPFCEVDALICAQVAYCNLDGVVPGEEEKTTITVAQAAERYVDFLANDPAHHIHGVISPLTQQLLPRMAAGERYKKARLSRWCRRTNPQNNEQFAALTIDFPAGPRFISFRGTDDTLVGWREDFDMTFGQVPAQADAAAYLERTGARRGAPLMLGGHSKGGNLAMYAAHTAPKRLFNRIDTVWNMDGPGFDPSVATARELAPVQAITRTYVPAYDIVAGLLSQHTPYKRVASDERGVMQHSAMSWQVEATHFVEAPEQDPESVAITNTLNRWLKKESGPARKAIYDGFFTALEGAGVRTISGLSEPNAELYAKVASNVSQLPQETRDYVADMLADLFKTLVACRAKSASEAVRAKAGELWEQTQAAAAAAAASANARSAGNASNPAASDPTP